MRRPINLAIAAACAALVGATVGSHGLRPVTAQASGSCHGCTDFTQTVAAHNTGKATNSVCFDQIIGNGTKGNDGSIAASAGACDGLGTSMCFNDPLVGCFVDQEIGTVAGSNKNSGKITNSTGQTIGLDQFIGSLAGNDMFTGVTGSSSNNKATLDQAGDDTPLHLSSGNGGCGPGSGDFCGQLIAGGNSNQLTWKKSHGDSQEIVFFDILGGKGANSNVLNLQGGHNVQWVTNSTNPGFIDAAENGAAEPTSGGVVGLNASKNKLSFIGSNSVQLVQNGNKNDLTGQGNFINQTILNGSGNKVTTNGNSDTVTINGTSTSSTADNNTVSIIGNYDTVTLIGLSNQHIVVRGNNLTCDPICH
jgi:hypothetical protein